MAQWFCIVIKKIKTLLILCMFIMQIQVNKLLITRGCKQNIVEDLERTICR